MKMLSLGDHFDSYTCQGWAGLGATYPLIDDRATGLHQTISNHRHPYNVLVDASGKVLHASITFNISALNAILDTLLAPASASPVGVPEKARLISSFPNPFNAGTRIDYEIEQRGSVEIRIHDAGGGLVRTLLNDHHAEGAYSIDWYGQNDAGGSLPSGVYLVTLQTGGSIDSHKLLLLK